MPSFTVHQRCLKTTCNETQRNKRAAAYNGQSCIGLSAVGKTVQRPIEKVVEQEMIRYVSMMLYRHTIHKISNVPRLGS